MIDAYEIGIRLALENGVSEGIAIIKRELTALDAAVAKSAAGLINLQGLANSLATYSLPQAQAPGSRPLTVPPPPVAASAPEPGVTPPATRLDDGLAQRTPETARPGISPAPPASPAVAPVPERVVIEQRQVSPQSPDIAAAARHIEAPALTHPPATAPSAPAKQPQYTPTGLEPPAPPEPPRAPLLVASAHLPASSQESTLPQVAPPAEPARDRVRVRSEATPDREIAAAPSAARPSQTFHRPAAPIAPFSRIVSNPEASRPVAPIASPVARLTTAAREERAEEPSRSTPQQSAERRPTEGHIYLEGAVLGRWLSEQLSRAATRPRSGVTDFDPRISPPWPGAPVGY